MVKVGVEFKTQSIEIYFIDHTYTELSVTHLSWKIILATPVLLVKMCNPVSIQN